MNLSVRQRFSLLARAAVGIFTGVLPDSTGYDLLSRIWPGAAGPPPLAGTRERLGAYGNTPWLHAVAAKVAEAFAAVEWKLYVIRKSGKGPALRAPALQKATLEHRRTLLKAAKTDGDLVEVENHMLLDAIDIANAYQTGQAMRKTWMLHFDLTGDAFLLKERNGLGAPSALWPIPPNWIMWTPTATRRTYRVSFRGWQGEIPDTEFLWISNPNPENPYGRGIGKAQVLADEIETDEYASKHTRQTFLNQNRPDFLVYPKSGATGPQATWTEPERLRLQHDWGDQHQGFWRAAKARFASRELGIYEFKEQNFRSLQLVQLREFERDTIRQVYGVPPEIMGIIEPGSARATIERSMYVFAKLVLEPRLEFFRTALQEFFVPEYDDRLIIDYVSPVEDDRQTQLSAATAAPWGPTLDEWRVMQGLPALPNGAGAVHMVPINLTPSALGDPAQDIANLATADLIKIRGRIYGGG